MMDLLFINLALTLGAIKIGELFFISMQEVGGGCIEPRGTVKMIQAARDAKSNIFPFCHLSAKLPQNGADKNSTNGRIPIRNPHWLAFIPICLKYTPIRGNSDPNAE
jgi:hypothetical protein